ncbi:MAG: putative addiction module antidote protein [Planctomycetes bacterium]|nr:putative addiction module antidote protein [Planctomycetota bacterium]
MLQRWDSAEHLHSQKDIALYFDAAVQEGGDDPAYMLHVLGIIARARGMMKLASDAGLTRGGPYKALAPDTRSGLQTVQGIAKALGFRLTLSRAA